MKKYLIIVFIYLFTCNCIAQTKTDTYQSLLQLFKELTLLEHTSLPNGVPDYSKQTILKSQQTLQQYKSQLSKIDTIGWSLDQKVDFVLLLAEMNAMDFNCRILKPWVRDPAFYAIIFSGATTL